MDADPCPWIDILFYAVKNYGAYFIAQPHIVASWSRRKIKRDAEHHLFTVASGTLKTQNYFNAVKKKLDPQVYTVFLHKELMGIYVLLFPVIKINVGNRIMLQIASKIRSLDPTMSHDLRYWLYLFVSLVLPRSLLRIARDMYLYVYTLVSKVEHNDEIVKTLKGLKREYSKGLQPALMGFLGYGNDTGGQRGDMGNHPVYQAQQPWKRAKLYARDFSNLKTIKLHNVSQGSRCKDA